MMARSRGLPRRPKQARNSYGGGNHNGITGLRGDGTTLRCTGRQRAGWETKSAMRIPLGIVDVFLFCTRRVSTSLLWCSFLIDLWRWVALLLLCPVQAGPYIGRDFGYVCMDE